MTLPIEDIHSLASRGELIAYFGYGSLVNPATHRTPVIGYTNARLVGWKRRWVARPDYHTDPIALLTSSPCHSSSAWLDGLLVFDRRQHLRMLDERENGYDRRVLTRADLEIAGMEVPPTCPIYVYEGKPPPRPDLTHFILQSYLDAVLQGYFKRYGEQGVRVFMSSTAGFDKPVLQDRSKPRYPRHVCLSAKQKLLIDELTASLTFIQSF